MEKDKDGFLPGSIKIKTEFEIPYGVLNINDDFIDRNKLNAAAEAGAREAINQEVARQFEECSEDGTLPPGWRIEFGTDG